MSVSGKADIAEEDCLVFCPTAHTAFGGRRQLPNFIRNNRRPWRGQGYNEFPDKSEHAQNKYRGCDDDRSNHNENNGDLIFHYNYRADWPWLSCKRNGGSEAGSSGDTIDGWEPDDCCDGLRGAGVRGWAGDANFSLTSCSMAGNIEMSWAIFSCFAESCFMVAAS
jgi:hypothetical protein